jgi:hypothetical protein
MIQYNFPGYVTKRIENAGLLLNNKNQFYVQGVVKSISLWLDADA